MKADRFFARAALTPPAVILQSSFANALGIIRDLGSNGVPVLALDSNPRALGFVSRWAAGMLCPDPLADEEAFIRFLEHLGERLPRPGVVFPTHDEYIWPVARHRERLDRFYRVPFSGWQAMSRLADKEEQIVSALRVGVGVPRTVFIRSRDDLAAHADEIADIGFPAIFKPVESLAFKLRFHRPVLEIPSADALDEVYDRCADCGVLMLQEIVPGGDDELWTVGSYVDAGSQPLAVFTGRKLRQHPRTFGTARFAESVWVPELADAGVRLLQELGYHGVSQVEFKRDVRSGEYKLMEVNARHWLWHALSTACGVNLSLAAYRDAIGEPEPAPRQVDGRRWILLTKDGPDSLLEMLRRETAPADWLRSLRGTRIDGLYDMRDPVPGAIATWRFARMVWARRLARLRARPAAPPSRDDMEL